MKKIFLFFILITGIVFGQEKIGFFSDALLRNNRSSDVTDMSKYFLSTGKVNAENFDEKNIVIQYSILMDLDKFNDLGDKSIFNKITKHVINDASYKVKNKYTYIPRKISFFPTQDGTFQISLEYSAENDFGATKTGDFFGSLYDDKGNFIKNEYEDKLKEIYSK